MKISVEVDQLTLENQCLGCKEMLSLQPLENGKGANVECALLNAVIKGRIEESRNMIKKVRAGFNENEPFNCPPMNLFETMEGEVEEANSMNETSFASASNYIEQNPTFKFKVDPTLN